MYWFYFGIVTVKANWPVNYHSRNPNVCETYMNGIWSINERCMCALNQTLDPTWFRCSSSWNRVIVLQETNQTLSYLETGYPALTNATRTCYNISQIPNQEVVCHWSTPTIGAMVWSLNTSVTFDTIDFYCLSTKGTMRNTYGYHPLDYYCITNYSLYCNTDTTLSSYNETCVCKEGWTGDRCTIPLQPLTVLQLWYQGQFLLNTSIYNTSRLCESDTDCIAVTEKCYQSLLSSLNKFCYCAPGAYPTSGANAGCSFRPTKMIAGVWFNYSFVDIHYLMNDDPLMVWYTWPEDGSIRMAYNVYPPNDTYARINITHLHAVLLSSVPVEENISYPYQNCSGHGSFDTTTGECLCDTRWLGPSCDVYDLICAQDLCNDNGLCFKNLTCQCVSPTSVGSYLANISSTSSNTLEGYGLNCSFTPEECRSARCSNHGSCGLDPYQKCDCDAWYAGYDCSIPTCTHPDEDVWTFSSQTCVCGNIDRYYGLHCELSYCNGHGERSERDHRCICDASWTGSSCEISLCDERLNATTCSSCTGSRILTDAQDACVLPCINGGTYDGLTQTCVCPKWTTGSFCEVSYIAVPTMESPTSVVAILFAFFILLIVLVALLLFVRMLIMGLNQQAHKKR
jgi:hypothetical protein